MPKLSPHEKRKILLQISNPPPGGNDRISLLHFERCQRQGRAHMVAGLVVFGVMAGAPQPQAAYAMRGRPRLPMSMSNRTGTAWWPCIPRYSGRPLGDFLEVMSRNRRPVEA